MPYTNHYLAKLDIDEALRLVLMDVYTADQYSIKIRDAAVGTAIEQIKGLFMDEPIKEPCPNCQEPNPDIEQMPDGSCGVCSGSGEIQWRAIGETWAKFNDLTDQCIANKLKRNAMR
jgi:hypothetical protein